MVEEVEKLRKTVNPAVNEQHRQAEDEYNELVKKRDKMVGDKEQIS
jgi:chromosome segregation ATPase